MPKTKTKLFDQQEHPELRAGEKWITNTNSSWECGFISIRKGKVAYSMSGEVISGYSPYFVLISEAGPAS